MLNDWHHSCPVVGHTELQIRRRTSPSYALLLDILPSSHYCSRILFVLILLPAMNHL
jgi:hypothetical protein